MPTSEKQIAANRRNAKKSIGPNTPEGKAVASHNAIKHGLHSCDIILKPTHLTRYCSHSKLMGHPQKRVMCQVTPTPLSAWGDKTWHNEIGVYQQAAS